jgi:hypothetical protein
MKKILFLTASMLTIASSVKSQTVITDTVSMGPGYANFAFYNVSTGVKNKMPINSWHMSHTSNTRDNALKFNHTGDAFVYLYPNGDNKSFANFDTTGWSKWLKPYNDLVKHEEGALNKQKSSNMWDFSWGVYDAATHKVVGDSMYLITLGKGQNMRFFKFMPVSQESNGDFIFTIAELNGSNAVTDTLKQSLANGATYKYFNFSTMKQVDGEPDAMEGWHLNFTRYYVPTLNQGVYIPYITAGVESKRGIRIAKFKGLAWSDLQSKHVQLIDDANADTSGGKGFRNELTRVGHDWKSFNGQAFVVADSMNYIVEVPTTSGKEFWGVRFTGFGGSATGNVILQRVLLTSLSSSEALTKQFVIFPVPATNELFVKSINNSQINTINIYSLDGRLVTTQNVGLNEEISALNISNLTAGQYIVEVRHNEGTQSQIINKL